MLDTLINTLGEVGLFAWQAAYRQTIVSGISWMIMFILSTITCIFIIKRLIRRQKEENSEGARRSYNSDWEAEFISSIAAALFLVVVSIVSLNVTLNYLIATDYQAMYLVKGLIK